MRTALVGHPMLRFDAPKLIGPVPQAGRMIELVEAHGKHLEVTWDDGLVLDTYLKGKGEWHVYRPGHAVAPFVGAVAGLDRDRRLGGGVLQLAERRDVPPARSRRATRATGGSARTWRRRPPISRRRSSCCSPTPSPRLGCATCSSTST